MTTQLEVLNHVIGVVGEAPVSNPNSTHPTAQSATLTIKRVSKQMQLRGWWFNQEKSLKLLPSVGGEIILPSNTLRIDVASSYSNLVKRGNRLYDTLNHTFIIDDYVIGDLSVQLEVDELPEVAAMYLMHKSAYDFYVADDGDKEKAQALYNETQMALIALNSEQLKMSKTNAKNRPAAYTLRAGIGQFGGSYNPNYPGGGR